jgi:hypothetical protein
MMHPVHPPQPRHRVQETVLEVHHQVEDDDSYGRVEPGWRIYCSKKAPSTFLGPDGERDARGGGDDSYDQGVERRKRDMRPPARAAKL